MKIFWFVFVTGLILFYLLVKAFKINVFSLEMFTHALYHFFIGFGSMTYFYFHRTVRLIKILLVFLFIFLALDQVYDYSRGVGHMNIKYLLFNFYLVFWGGLNGFSFGRLWTSE